MTYYLITYSDGRVTGGGEYDDLPSALQQAEAAMFRASGPDCDEYEITTTIRGRKDCVVAYAFDDDLWERRQ